MRLYLITFILLSGINACNNPAKESSSTQPPTTAGISKTPAAKPHFFPVTSYLKGQLFEIKQKGLTPMRYTTVNDKTDSGYVKLDDMEKAIHEFLTPVIDTANLIDFFTETEFLDQTINAVTFTCDPKGSIPDSIALRHWDVYIDPETQKVKRIYLVKTSNNNTLQLTWQSDAFCQMVTLAKDGNGNAAVIKEEKIMWSY